MTTITLPAGTTHIPIAEAYQLLRSKSDGVLDVYCDGQGNIEARMQGTWVLGTELQNEFMAFCEREKVTPRNKATPWSGGYTGEGIHNGIYEITVADFRRFAEGFGVAVEVAQPDDAPAAQSEAGRNDERDEHHIEEFLRLVQIRAKAENKTLNFEAMPGRRADLYDLWKATHPNATQSQATFNDWIKGRVKFLPAAKQSDFYRDLFPLHFSKG